MKIRNTADNSDNTQLTARDTRRMQEVNSLCVSIQVNSCVTCWVYAGGKRSLRAYIAVCLQIHCNPSSHQMWGPIGLQLHLSGNKFKVLIYSMIQNSLHHTVVKVPKSFHMTPILRSLHWLRINERIEYKLLSLTYTQFPQLGLPNLHTFITSYPCNVLAVLALNPSLLLLGHRHHPF